MEKKKYVSSKVVLRSLTSSKESSSYSHTRAMIIIGSILFIVGFLLVFHPEWLIDRMAFLNHP